MSIKRRGDTAGFSSVDHSEPVCLRSRCGNVGAQQSDVFTRLDLHSVRLTDPAWNKQQREHHVLNIQRLLWLQVAVLTEAAEKQSCHQDKDPHRVSNRVLVSRLHVLLLTCLICVLLSVFVFHDSYDFQWVILSFYFWPSDQFSLLCAFLFYKNMETIETIPYGRTHCTDGYQWFFLR